MSLIVYHFFKAIDCRTCCSWVSLTPAIHYDPNIQKPNIKLLQNPQIKNNLVGVIVGITALARSSCRCYITHVTTLTIDTSRGSTIECLALHNLNISRPIRKLATIRPITTLRPQCSLKERIVKCTFRCTVACREVIIRDNCLVHGEGKLKTLLRRVLV